MEVVFKSTQGKPKFMGLLFENERDARFTMMDIINNHRNELFTMKLSLSGGCASIRIISNSSNAFFMYPNAATCSMGDLQNWNRGEGGNFNFGHTIKEFDKHVLVKSLEKNINFYIRIQSLHIEYGR
jgi:hypothetical protein